MNVIIVFMEIFIIMKSGLFVHECKFLSLDDIKYVNSHDGDEYDQ